MDDRDFAHTVVPSAEDVLEDLLRQHPAEVQPALRAAFNLGRAHELAVLAHRAARALEELAEPDKPTTDDPWTSGLLGLGGGPFAC